MGSILRIQYFPYYFVHWEILIFSPTIILILAKILMQKKKFELVVLLWFFGIPVAEFLRLRVLLTLLQVAHTLIVVIKAQLFLKCY
jgi:hypothetical protein